MMLKEEIARLIPHTGSMCLVDRVIHWNRQSIRCSTRSHMDSSNPLRYRERLSSLVLIEYGAQTMAIHGGLLSRQDRAATPGYLAAVNDAKFHIDFVDHLTDELIIEAMAKLRLNNGVVYGFTVHCNGSPLLEARATIIHLPGEADHEKSVGHGW